jgi:putative chitinase
MTIQVEDLRAIAPSARGGLVGPLAEALTKYLPRYEIDTPLRQAHFLAQAAHETAGLTTLEELGGPSYFKRYDGRKDLGNVQAGDGYRFRGRGIFQITGRINYEAYGKRLRKDLVNDPEEAADPETSVRIACEYWKAKGLNGWADRDDVEHITRRINGGTNGLSSRKAYLAKAKRVLGANQHPAALAALTEEVPDAAIASDAPKGMMQSKEGGAAIIGGGLSVASVLEKARDWKDQIGDWLDPSTVLEFMWRPEVRPFVVIAILCALIWYWRYRRMHEGN